MSSTTRNYTIRLSASGKAQLEADLRALGASGERSLRRIQQAGKPASAGLRETDLAARQLKGSLGAIGQELPALQRLARFMGTTALIGGVVAFGKGALDVGREFQAMMQRVEAATGAGEAEMARLAGAAKELGATTAFTAMQAAEAIEVLAKNGVAVPKILNGALDASVTLASALGAEVAPAADLVTDLMAQFGLEASKLPEIVDRVTGAALTSKFGFDDLRGAIGQAGGVAGTAGVEIEDFLATLSATASSFSSGSDAGTSFKSFLQRLTPDSRQAAAVMQDLGLEFFDAAGNMKSMEAIAGELQDGLAGLSEEARNQALKTIFGTDAIRTAAALAKQGADGFRDIARAMSEVSAQEQAEVRMSGLDGALKEVAAAWEALQLEAAQNGGLDVAEQFVRRLTDALRYLTENFAEVEELAERVAQALTVYLVGKGMTLAIAKGVALQAALIEIAGAATEVGTAATRATGPMSRMGIAARALTGVLGGPLSLALTVASLIAFRIDTDTAADAVGRADAAALKAADALGAYQEAARRAAEEQKSLGGEVSATTQKMLDQSRAALEQAKADLERAYVEARSALSGSMFDGDGIDDFVVSLEKYRPKSDLPDYLKPLAEELRNDFLAVLAESAEAVEEGTKSVSDFVEEFDRLRSVGTVLEDVRDRIIGILETGGPLSENSTLAALVDMARKAGLFADEIAAIDAATTEADLGTAYGALTRALTKALEAGTLLRSETVAGFRENVTAVGKLEEKIGAVDGQMRGFRDLSEEINGNRPFDEAADSAARATAEVRRLNDIYGEYQRTRAHSDRVTHARGAADAARKGLRDLIGFAEGTDKGRGYNETLGYGAFTGGDVNLVAMTVNEVLALQKKMLAHPDNSYNSSAVGRYQIVSQTLRSLMGEMGLSGNEVFSTDLQDQMADRLIDRRGRNPGALRNEWEGLRRVSDDNILTAFDGGAGDRATGRAETSRKEADAARDRAEALARVLSVGRDQLEQLRLEAQLAGRSVEEQARLTFQYEALKRAREAGIDPEKTLAADGRIPAEVILEQAAAYGQLLAARDADARARERTEDQTKEQTERLREYKSEIAGLFDNLKPGGGGPEGFVEDFASMILDRLWQLAMDPVWDYLAQLMEGLFSGIGGIGGISPGAPGAAPSTAGLGTGGLYASGGPLPKRAGGGGFRAVPRAAGMLQGSGGKRQDNLLFWGSRGEFMQPAAAVDFYGVEFMEALRQRRIPKLADGGSLGGLPAAFSGTGSAPPITFIDQSGRGVDVETRERVEGGQRKMEFVLSDAVSSGLTTPGGKARRTMRTEFGLTARRPQR
ncbi:phage tail tape measure protein [Puniceibacterium confluentis]|uniref:phage tail tape measure protein n=1 Tax=Puniceibacterium confluentis TaxID=1958944 RepID=UPI0011B70691|nr:phage tail tape measure protein [Puniceibacterium confluentis]